MFRRRPVSLAIVALFVWVTGCTSYRQIELREVADYEKVRVTTTDGAKLDYYSPSVEADSIKGRRAADGASVYAVSLDRVAVIEEGGRDHGNSILLGVGLVAGAVVVGVVVYCVLSNDEYC